MSPALASRLTISAAMLGIFALESRIPECYRIFRRVGSDYLTRAGPRVVFLALRVLRLTGAKPQASKHGLLLASLVGLVAGLAPFVLSFGLSVQDLEFTQHIHDGAELFRAGWGECHDIARHAYRDVGDEVDHSVGRGAEAVVARRQGVVELTLELIGHLPKVRVLIAVAAK